MTGEALHGISSMATKGLLNELAARYGERSGVAVSFVSVGGVEAARRVAVGEAFDIVVLASDAIDRLAASGQVDLRSKVALARSRMGVAVCAGSPVFDVSSIEALRRAVLDAPGIGCSTGPSGVALTALFERMGIADAVRGRLVQAPPGVAVGSLIASGQVALGFQQTSELIGVAGIRLLEPLAEEAQIETVFSAVVGVGCQRVEAARDFLDHLLSPQQADVFKRQGLAQA